jgi:hypothetical protein
VPLKVQVDAAAAGELLPLTLSLQQAENATATLPGFVSRDGATVLLGSFRPFNEDPRRLREKLLSASPGVRVRKGAWYVTAFVDLQCERCRVRAPEVRDFAWTHGGAMEIRFLPLVKTHDWAFAGAECAAALAAVSPDLYERYEQAVGQRAATMSRTAAREVALDSPTPPTRGPRSSRSSRAGALASASSATSTSRSRSACTARPHSSSAARI